MFSLRDGGNCNYNPILVHFQVALDNFWGGYCEKDKSKTIAIILHALDHAEYHYARKGICQECVWPNCSHWTVGLNHLLRAWTTCTHINITSVIPFVKLEEN